MIPDSNFEVTPLKSIKFGDVLLLGGKHFIVSKIRTLTGQIELSNTNGLKFMFRDSGKVSRLRTQSNA